MSQARKVQLPWMDVDTVLLDMDGTLLDLAFDNFFWLELVPRCFAEAHGLDPADARREIDARYAEVVGTLPWYCVDHWSRELGLDIRGLKQAHSHLIRYLPRAEAFLAAARERRCRLVLVTNAHRDTLEIKAAVTGIDRWMDAVVSSHDYGAPKEDQAFWRELRIRHGIDPDRSALIEDSLAVLETATGFGLRQAVAIRCPDSRSGRREIDGFDAVDGVGDLM